MKFYFLDMITGIIYLGYLGVVSTNKVKSTIKNVLGYRVDQPVFDEVKKRYLNSLPPALLNVQ